MKRGVNEETPRRPSGGWHTRVNDLENGLNIPGLRIARSFWNPMGTGGRSHLISQGQHSLGVGHSSIVYVSACRRDYSSEISVRLAERTSISPFLSY